MPNQYPYRYNTTQGTASEDDSRYETPGGAQNKADTALDDAKEYTDAFVGGTANLADDSVTRPKIAPGAVGATELDPSLLDYTTDIAVANKFNEVDAQLAEGAQGANALKNRLIGGFVAHRGLEAMAPENTIKAIRAAAQAGFAMVEIDSTQTSDLKWVLMHDATVDRTTDGTGTVASLTLSQILDLHIDNPTSLILEDEVIRVPTLQEALEEISSHGMGVNIDGSKFSNTYANFQEIVGFLDDYNLTNNSIFILPSALGRQWVRQISPYITVGWISVVANVDNDIAEAQTLGNAIVGYSAATLTDEVVYKCNSANVPIYAYLANTYEQAYKWLSKGVLFVETDFYFLPGGAV